ncbi:MAG: elongation factor P [Myxococcota bacterium]|nr:elongation factor P [Myxococcota bacterium]
MATYSTSEFKNGIKILIDGQPYQMVYFQFVKPGKGTAFTRTKLKNLITGAVIERTFRSGEKVDVADCEEVTMQYMYQEGDMYNFMNMETYDQVGIPEDVIDYESKWLLDGMEVAVMMYNARPVGLTLPNFVEAEVTHTEPGVKGNTATGATKPATICNGAVVQVPLFIEQGETLKVDTREGGRYVSRAN